MRSHILTGRSITVYGSGHPTAAELDPLADPSAIPTLSEEQRMSVDPAFHGRRQAAPAQLSLARRIATNRPAIATLFLVLLVGYFTLRLARHVPDGRQHEVDPDAAVGADRARARRHASCS